MWHPTSPAPAILLMWAKSFPRNREGGCDEVAHGCREFLDFFLGVGVQTEIAEASIGCEGASFDEFRIHRLGENATGDFGCNTCCQHFTIRSQRRIYSIGVEHMHPVRPCNSSGFGALFEIGIAFPKFDGDPYFGRAIHVPAAHFIACEPDSVSEPFTCNKDGHFDAESELWVEEGADVIVIGEVADESFVACAHFGGFLVEGHARGVDDSEVIAECVQEFHEAGAPDSYYGRGLCT